MPWDPAPPQATPQPQQPVKPPQPLPPQSVPAPLPSDGEIRVKTEPGVSMPQPIAHNQSIGLQRASQHLQEKFGRDAKLQVEQLQQRAAIVGQANQAHKAAQQNRPSMPQSMLSNESLQAYQVRQRAYAEQQRLVLQNKEPKSFSNSQTDGAAEWASIVEQRRCAIDLDAVASADFSVRQRVAEMNQAMEGGGAMRPHSTHASSSYTKTSSAKVGEYHANIQVDGTDDYEVKDEEDEEINSELDDSDDEERRIDDDEDDGKAGEMMVCTYEKVNRVKNKWKCNLKDGLLVTGGKE